MNEMAPHAHMSGDPMMPDGSMAMDGGMSDPAHMHQMKDHAAFMSAMEGLYGLTGTALEAAAGAGAEVVVAAASGDWSDPATWAGGSVPGANALVVVPEGVEVTYDVAPGTAAPIFAVRIQGALDFATDQDTEMVVDTIFSEGGSRLTVGTPDDPVDGGFDAEIIIRSDTAPADQRDWDPGEFSKGVVTMGAVRIAGEEKTSKLTLADDLQAGDQTLVLEGAATGWNIGDTLILQGTSFDANGSDADNTRFHDEELLITDVTVSGGETIVSFTNLDTGGTALRFDHDAPGDADVYVANMTRSVTIRSEAGEASLPTAGGDAHERGHTMFMHNHDVQIHDAAFEDLGRTDKLELSGADNVKGRYALHIHRAGAEDIEGEPAVVEGVAVSGTPGWGIAHHQSHLNILDSVVFGAVGAGIAAEAGDEIGLWQDNLVIKTTGDGVSISGAEQASSGGGWDAPGGRNAEFDFGFAGEAYWVQGGAQVQIVDNVAASSVNGLAIFQENTGLVDKDAEDIAVGNLRIRNADGTLENTPVYEALIDAGYTDTDRVPVGALPTKEVDGFTAANVNIGALVWQVQSNIDRDGDFNLSEGEFDNHGARGALENFTVWGATDHGLQIENSTGLDIVNANLSGVGSGSAVDMSPTSSGIAYDGLTQAGFGSSGFRDAIDFRDSPTGARLEGGPGDDIFYGSDASDSFRGGAGDDTIFGGAGNDTLFGGDGRNVVVGGEGDDNLRLGSGADQIFGGAGDDVVVLGQAEGYHAEARISGGDGFDRLTTDGYRLILTDFDSVRDSIESLGGREEGGAFNNNNGFQGSDDDDRVILTNIQEFISLNSFKAGLGDDLYVGSAVDDTAYGEDGDDFMTGSAGNDRLFGGDGDDVMRVSAGNDSLAGDDGADTFEIGGEFGAASLGFAVDDGDSLRIALDEIKSLDDLLARSSRDGKDLKVTLEDGAQFVLRKTKASDLTADNVEFVDALDDVDQSAAPRDTGGGVAPETPGPGDDGQDADGGDGSGNDGRDGNPVGDPGGDSDSGQGQGPAPTAPGEAVVARSGLSIDARGDVVEIAHSDDLELEGGTILMRFTADSPGGKGRDALFSKDAKGNGDGHVTAFIDDGDIVVRFQSDTDQLELVADADLAAGDSTEIAFVFGDGGAELYLNGALADVDADFTIGLDGNTEDLLIGGNGWGRSDRRPDKISDAFDGEIETFEIYADRVSSDDFVL
ncbi:MAG: G8 domain-containing protein [Pseudomonadota bacterium]